MKIQPARIKGGVVDNPSFNGMDLQKILSRLSRGKEICGRGKGKKLKIKKKRQRKKSDHANGTEGEKSQEGTPRNRST